MTDMPDRPSPATCSPVPRPSPASAPWPTSWRPTPASPSASTELSTSSSPARTDATERAEIDRIAAALGETVSDETGRGGHYTVSKTFGRITYTAIHIPAERRTAHAALMSYAPAFHPERVRRRLMDDAERPADLPPIKHYQCCHCGGTGLDSHGDTCAALRGPRLLLNLGAPGVAVQPPSSPPRRGPSPHRFTTTGDLFILPAVAPSPLTLRDIARRATDHRQSRTMVRPCIPQDRLGRPAATGAASTFDVPRRTPRPAHRRRPAPLLHRSTNPTAYCAWPARRGAHPAARPAPRSTAPTPTNSSAPASSAARACPDTSPHTRPCSSP